MTAAPGERAQPPVSWSWPLAGLGAAYGLPAAAVMPVDPSQGFSLAVGVQAPAAMGLPGPRRARVRIAVIGSATGLSLFLGSLLAQVPVVAVLGIFALSVGAALLAWRFRFGVFVLTLCLPIAGAGLSYDDVGDAAGTFALMSAGAVYAWLVSLCWPGRTERSRPSGPPMGPSVTRADMLAYGVRLGVAAATAAAIGFALEFDHVGWACCACLIVSRPSVEMTKLRGVGRAASVTVGALAAVLLVRAQPSAWILAITVVVVLAALAGVAGSRWYITSAFTTFNVFQLLLLGSPDDARFRFNERVLETLLGVGLALLFGWLLPMAWSRRR